MLGVVAMATWAPFLTPPLPARTQYGFDEVLDTEEGWAKCNRAIAEEVARPVRYRPVETDGAQRAAALLAELI